MASAARAHGVQCQLSGFSITCSRPRMQAKPAPASRMLTTINRNCDLRSKRSSHMVMAGKIQEIDEQELEVAVANRDKPLIIDFFATWCGPCVLLAKELEEVAETMGDAVKILKIDCDKNEAISAALQIQGLPTLIFVGMDPTKPALRTEGLLPAQAIVEIVQKELLGQGAVEE